MWKRALHETARRQHGVIERRQAVALAPTRSAARHELGCDHWIAASAFVFRLRGSPDTTNQRLMIAVLGAGSGAVVSHHSAAALWGIPGASVQPTHLTVLRDTNRRGEGPVVLHRARRLGADQITELDGLPITRPERVPFDLANIGEPAARIERVIDRLWSDRLVSGRSLRRVHASLPKRGFRGTALMRDLLDARPDDWVPPASGLEGRTMRLLERAGLTRYERQVDIGGDEWVGRVDFVNRRDRIIIEVQSDRHHAALSSRRDDQERFARLRAAGYEVVPVWEDEVWHRPDDFVQRVWQSVHRTRTGSGIGR
jgi:very-short-patch-repair endonuclease